jgi:hypothetical protein
MTRRLFSGAALVVFAALTASAGAGALETGGEHLTPEINISPMTAAIVQSAQARIFGGSALQQARGGAAAAQDGSTGNPSMDRLLGTSSSRALAGQKALRDQLLARTEDLVARRASASGGFFDGGGASDSSGLLVGGVPVVNNVTNVTNQSGVITNVTATATVNGNNNTAVLKVDNVGNGNSFKASGKAPVQ